ncbi:MAG TPA: flagellar assembly peptidoglycan hydrolase FlgJ [Burkholderiaceae bacterium]|jgi:flagellar protein FlgJ|nr:flagellar assembly peptidoglycan hydrolase FlgJ [Burkholderiaceae bacterium]
MTPASLASTDALRARAASDPRGAVKDAARQFEAIFMQELMKSMRTASLSSGLLDNAGTKLGSEMLDTQFAAQMTGMPGGLSELIARQLERQIGTPQNAAPAAAALPVAPGARAADFSALNGRQRQAAFVQTHRQAAQAAEEQTGIPASFMLAQAAHESGWGQRPIRNADGSSANNLFGIKAGAGWKGAVAEVVTTEFVDGKPKQLVQRFRAYASAEESFRDYARLMTQNSRYSQVLASGGDAKRFAQGLQAAGYATDPAYADKLARIIDTTVRLERAAA